MSEFNEQMRKRTKDIALRVIKMYAKLPKTEELKVIGRQILRSATSVGANYRAACRARSDNEFYAKISIVIEECDETLFWLELLEESELLEKERLIPLKEEVLEVLKILVSTRKAIKMKLNKN